MFFTLLKSAQEQLNHIHLWVVQGSDLFLFFSSQIWTSPVTLQLIKPNYPHYQDHQIIFSNQFDATYPCVVWFRSQSGFCICYPECHLCKMGDLHCLGWIKSKMFLHLRKTFHFSNLIHLRASGMKFFNALHTKETVIRAFSSWHDTDSSGPIFCSCTKITQ